MHTLSLFHTLLLAIPLPLISASSVLVARAAVDGPCTGASNAPGVCLATAKCTSGGGTFISGACPGTPDDVKCCTKPSCGSGNAGNCRFTSSCSSGITESNQCPGPATFKCCMPSGSSGGGGGGGGGSTGGGYPAPNIPTLASGCKQTAITGAKTISAAFPGKIAEIGCKRACSDSSQHCYGMANDLMVTKIGSRSTEGQAIAEWIMNRASALSLRYVMWGQRIWQPSRDSVKPWNQWRYQACTVIPNCVGGDRGDNTQNHWDHVHISYD